MMYIVHVINLLTWTEQFCELYLLKWKIGIAGHFMNSEALWIVFSEKTEITNIFVEICNSLEFGPPPPPRILP